MQAELSAERRRLDASQLLVRGRLPRRRGGRRGGRRIPLLQGQEATHGAGHVRGRGRRPTQHGGPLRRELLIVTGRWSRR